MDVMHNFNKTYENFVDFLNSSKIHQKADRETRYEIGANPKRSGDMSNTLESLEKIESIIYAAKNKLNNIDSNQIDPYIKRQLEKSYLELRSAYLRLMDI